MHVAVCLFQKLIDLVLNEEIEPNSLLKFVFCFKLHDYGLDLLDYGPDQSQHEHF